jgi:hypothetical protein
MEDAHQRPLVRRARERPACKEVPAFSRAVDRGEQSGAARRQVELHPGALIAEADHVPVVAGPEGAAGEPEVERFEQVRLAGSIRAVNHHDTVPDLRPVIDEVAEPAALDCADDGH